MAAGRVEELQRWMQEQIRHPRAAGGEAAVDDVLTASSQLSGRQRLGIYQSAYVARLLECLRAEFPATAALAGEESFAALAQGYLETRPSRSYTLGDLGAGFPEFLRSVRPSRDAEGAGLDFADALIETARVERIYSEVFDGSGPEELPAFDPKQVSPEQFAGARLTFHACVRLVRLPLPVHGLITAVRRGEAWEVPAEGLTCLVITRRDYVVRRFAVEPLAFALLERLQASEGVGAALTEVFGDGEITAAMLRSVGEWFEAWAAAPLFRGMNSRLELVCRTESE
ncbi:MAG TPA: DNA-binding domain-containing protein [Planctomycetaceae bacterium]|nr:DNA-binding domain-containing protein [Planctomycetaceae bacterium]